MSNTTHTYHQPMRISFDAITAQKLAAVAAVPELEQAKKRITELERELAATPLNPLNWPR